MEAREQDPGRSATTDGRPRQGGGGFIGRVVAVLLLLAIALLARTLSNVLLIVFGAALIAVVLRAAATPLLRWTPLPQAVAVLVALLVLVLLFAGGGWLFGRQIVDEWGRLSTELPGAVEKLETEVRRVPLGEHVLSSVHGLSGGQSNFASRALSAGSLLASAVSQGMVALFAGVYLALKPGKYRDGFAKLFPKQRSAGIASGLENAGQALRLWLLGQLVSMATVGLLTGIGLALIGVPSAIALGVIAGLLEFIPLVGPVISAIPGVALASLQGTQTMFLALGVYVAVQQIESNLLTPFVEKWAVSLPPAVTLVGVLSMGVLFGGLGVVLAAPLVVTIFVLVQQIYVRDTLGYPIQIAGQRADGG